MSATVTVSQEPTGRSGHGLLALGAAGLLALGIVWGAALGSGSSPGASQPQAEPARLVLPQPQGAAVTYYIIDAEPMRQKVIEAENGAALERLYAGVPDEGASYQVLLSSTPEEYEQALGIIGKAAAAASRGQGPAVYVTDLRGK